MNWHWPQDKSMALCLSFDIDAETLWLTRNDINARHLVHMSRGLYATKQALPRILNMLEAEDLRATFFNGSAKRTIMISGVSPFCANDSNKKCHDDLRFDSSAESLIGIVFQSPIQS